MTIFDQLNRDEGRKKFPYLDCCGKPWRQCTCKVKGNLTIGVGRNLDAVGLYDNEIDLLTVDSLTNAKKECENNFTWWESLDEIRQDVVAMMTYNMGIGDVKKFTTFIQLVATKKYVEAGNDLETTLWAREVGDRAKRLAQQMRTGIRQ